MSTGMLDIKKGSRHISCLLLGDKHCENRMPTTLGTAENGHGSVCVILAILMACGQLPK